MCFVIFVNLSKMKLVLAILAFVIGAEALQMSIKDCKIGTEEVDSFIKYECYSEGSIVRGIRPIGCVPSDDMTGQVLGDQETHKAQYFWYKCSIKGNTASYDITDCIGPDGATMSPGDTEKDKDGGTWTCLRNTDGSVTMKYAEATGCTFNGNEHNQNEMWEEDNKKLVCYKQGGKYLTIVMACIGDSGEEIKPGKYKKVGDSFFKCEGRNYMPAECKLAQITDPTCHDSASSNTFELDQFWESNGLRYACKLDKNLKTYIVVTGCVYSYADGEKFVSLWRILKADDGEWVHCRKISGKWGIFVIQAGIGTTICKLPNDEEKELFQSWVDGMVRYKCAYEAQIATIEAYGCQKGNIRYGKNQIRETKPCDQEDHLCAWKCEDGEDGYDLRQLTKEEYTKWKARGKQSGGGGKEFTGNGGSGSGAHRTTTTTTTTEPTTTTTTTPEPTTTTTTTPAPTTTTTTTTTPTPTTTTTTPAPTTTTTTTTTTTQAPTTTTTLAPTTTTTTTQAPTTTTTTPTPTTTTTTPAPTTTTTVATTTTTTPEPTTTTTTTLPTTTTTTTAAPTTTTTEEPVVEPTTSPTPAVQPVVTERTTTAPPPPPSTAAPTTPEPTTARPTTTEAPPPPPPPSTTVQPTEECVDKHPVCQELAEVCGEPESSEELSPEAHERIRRAVGRIARSAEMASRSRTIKAPAVKLASESSEEEISNFIAEISIEDLSAELEEMEEEEYMEEAEYSDECECPCPWHHRRHRCPPPSGCGCGRPKPRPAHCKRCNILKHKAKELVKALCPKTCSNCKNPNGQDLSGAIGRFMNAWNKQ